MQEKRRKPAKEKLTDRFIRAIAPPSIGVHDVGFAGRLRSVRTEAGGVGGLSRIGLG